MVVRIRFRNGPKIHRKRRKNRHVALALAALLRPAALTALSLAFWRIGADLRMAGQFAIHDGLFSHSQVWVAIAFVIEIVAIVLSRYGNGQALLRPLSKRPNALLDSRV